MYNPYSYELYHHGILGQKWGVRRFQNEDRTWTEAGKERYGRGARKIANKVEETGNKITDKIKPKEQKGLINKVRSDIASDVNFYTKMPNWIGDKMSKKKTDKAMDREVASRVGGAVGGAVGTAAGKLVYPTLDRLERYGIARLAESNPRLEFLSTAVNSPYYSLGSRLVHDAIASHIGSTIGSKIGESVYDSSQKKKEKRDE